MGAAEEPSLVDYRRILVTGGSGFVGSVLVAALRSRWPLAKVVVADRMGGRTANHLPLDLQDPASIREAVVAVEPDLVVHLAAEASVSSADASSTSAWRSNTVATLDLAAALREHSPKSTVFFTSSSEVYGRAFLQGPVDEDTPPEPVSVYARSKLAAEYILATVLAPEARLIIVRPSNHVGPGQDERFVVPAFASQIARAERGGDMVLKVGNLDSARDFMSVRDVVAVYITLLAMPFPAGGRDVFNVASGIPRTIGSLLEMLRRMASCETSVEIEPVRSRPSAIPSVRIDVSRLCARTGWSPSVDIQPLLGEVLDWARAKAGG